MIKIFKLFTPLLILVFLYILSILLNGENKYYPMLPLVLLLKPLIFLQLFIFIILLIVYLYKKYKK